MLIQQKYNTAEKIFSAGILDRDLAEIQCRELLKYKDKLKSKNLFLKYKIGLVSTLLMLLILAIKLIKIQTIIELNNEKLNQLETTELTTESEIIIKETTELITELEIIITETTELTTEIVIEPKHNYQLDKFILIQCDNKINKVQK